jgi:thymidylate synthase
MTNIYNHNDLHEMNLYPCAYSLTFNVTGNKLNVILNQRSQDMLTAMAWNVAQYSILTHMFASVSNLEVGEFIHVIADAHIYDRHAFIVEELIERDIFAAPTLIMNKKENFYDYKVEDFILENYEHGAAVKNIPVAI